MQKLGRPKDTHMTMPGAVQEAEGLHAVDRIVYCAIYSMCDGGLEVFASNEYLARLAGCGARHAKRSIEILKHAGLLEHKYEYYAGTEIIKKRYLHALSPWVWEPEWDFTDEQRREFEKRPKRKANVAEELDEAA